MSLAIRFDSEQLPVDKLTGGHLHELRKLNDKLSVIEQQIVQQAKEIRDFYEMHIKPIPATVEDFELEVTVSFDLKRTDPLFNPDNANELASLKEYISPLKEQDYFGLADNTNHNEFQHMNNHPMKEEHHCWLYHVLYDHKSLGWINILRIGEISVWTSQHLLDTE